MNYSATLYGPVYRTQGVPVQLTVGATVYPLSGTLRFLDKTAGLQLPGTLEVETVQPVAMGRVKDIVALGLTLDDLDDATLLMNGKTWLVKSHRPMPSPGGEADGEVALLLEATL